MRDVLGMFSRATLYRLKFRGGVLVTRRACDETWCHAPREVGSLKPLLLREFRGAFGVGGQGEEKRL